MKKGLLDFICTFAAGLAVGLAIGQGWLLKLAAAVFITFLFGCLWALLFGIVKSARDWLEERTGRKEGETWICVSSTEARTGIEKPDGLK